MIELVSRNLFEPNIAMSCRILENNLFRTIIRRRVDYNEFVYFSSLLIKPL